MCYYENYNCSKMTTVGLFAASHVSTFFSSDGPRVCRLFFHKWRLIFALEIVDDIAPHRQVTRLK
jgi:hypothetical protein